MMNFFLPRKVLWLAACLSLPLAVPATAAPEGKVHQHRTAKPGAGLGLASGSEYQLEAGRVQSITLTLSSAVQQGTLNVALSSSDSKLELLSPATYEFDLSSEQPPTLTVELLPHENGRYYLMLNARVERQGKPAQGQSFGAAVQVGEKAVSAQQLKASSAPRVISLPAQETIRPAN